MSSVQPPLLSYSEHYNMAHIFNGRQVWTPGRSVWHLHRLPWKRRHLEGSISPFLLFFSFYITWKCLLSFTLCVNFMMNGPKKKHNEMTWKFWFNWHIKSKVCFFLLLLSYPFGVMCFSSDSSDILCPNVYAFPFLCCLRALSELNWNSLAAKAFSTSAAAIYTLLKRWFFKGSLVKKNGSTQQPWILKECFAWLMGSLQH